MFGIDSFLKSIQSLLERIKEFMGLVDTKGVGGAFAEVAQNTANDLINETKQQFNTIPQTLKLGEELLGQISTMGGRTSAQSVATNSPPASTPATPASTTPQTPSV